MLVYLCEEEKLAELRAQIVDDRLQSFNVRGIALFACRQVGL